ncbi:MAG: IPT/TIG domain-containing protein, partial [Bacillota bacterium]
VSPPRPTALFPAGTLTLASLTWAAKVNRIDWGMKPYPLAAGDGLAGTADDVTNGGITGIVYYAVMRNEWDPRMAAAESYEPGIPGVTVNLYRLNPDDTLTLVDTVQTDAWEHPTDCPRPDGTLDPLCLEVPNNSNQIRAGVFDGGYAFSGVAPGRYVVEVVPPPGYSVLAEGSENTGDGDQFRILTLPAAAAAAAPAPAPPAGQDRLSLPPAYYGTSRDKKIVVLQPGENGAADFFLYTDVPIPGRIVGFLLDDVNIETDPARIYYGEKRGIPGAPVGIRDFSGRLLTTVYSDPNGVFEVLLPSTYTRNVPTPSGVVPGMYRVVGNDPGDPDNPDPAYNPNYETTAFVFDVWPGKTTYADIALFPITAFVAFSGQQFARPPMIDPPPGTPQIHLVEPVYVEPAGQRTVTILGSDFGPATGQVTLGDVAVPILAWAHNQIRVSIPAAFATGPAQLMVRTGEGKASTMGLTFHVLGPGYSPRVLFATPVSTIQAAIDQARDGDLIVVRPGIYTENPILYKNIKLQGMGWKWTRIDGRFFAAHATAWEAKLNQISYDGAADVSRGQVITVVAQRGRLKRAGKFGPQIDGLTITGARGEEGGGIIVHAYGQELEISNNLVQNNAGGFGGAITIGKPYAGDNHNDGLRIHHNRILNNGGISLAGGIGIFNGAYNYEIAFNDIGGNYSAEYGGGISHLGLSSGGRIHHNRILFNASFDEGGGILVGGEQPIPPAVLSAGSGEVTIYSNLIQGNLANDDGGGIRTLRAGTHAITIYNNLIVNNVSTDLGGGIALDDSSNVAIYNNTIAKNATTATAEDSDGQRHGAGIASEPHSTPFQSTLPPGAPTFSDPVLFNNLFWDNRAYRFDPSSGSLDPAYAVIDLEVVGAPVPVEMTPNYSFLSTPYGTGVGNIVYGGANPPGFVSEYTTAMTAVAFHQEPTFISVRIVTVTPDLQGDYHLTAGSPAIGAGVGTFTVGTRQYHAPADDIDGNPRPPAGVDLGAAQYVAP